MLLELETLARLPKYVRQDIEQYCELRGQPYATLLAANRTNIWEMARVNGLIVYLGSRGYTLKEIHTAAGVAQDYAQRVLEHARAKETPIKTTNWERFAGCKG